MLKVLGISGSPRRRGNSAALLARTLEAAQTEGAECLPTVYANDMSFRGCQFCDGCAENGICIRRDDMTAVYGQLEDASIWLFASPIFFDNVSGQLKCLFDRLYCLSQPSRVKLPGKRSAAFIITYEDKPRPDYVRSAGIYNRYIKRFGDFVFTDVLDGFKLAGANDVAKRPELLEQAAALGRRLVQKLKGPK